VANGLKSAECGHVAVLAVTRPLRTEFTSFGRNGEHAPRACCLGILDKGKPVARPGRKAKGRRLTPPEAWLPKG